MAGQMDKKIREIRILFDNEDYISALNLCNLLEKEVNKNINDVDKSDLYFINYEKAILYLKLNKYKLMKKYALKARNYWVKPSQDINACWLLARFYGNIQSENKQKIALRLYEKIEFFYRQMNEMGCVSQMLINRGIILHSVELHQEAIKLLKETDPFNIEKIDRYYASLFETCIYNKNYFLAKSTIKKIHNKKIQLELSSNQSLEQFRIA